MYERDDTRMQMPPAATGDPARDLIGQRAFDARMALIDQLFSSPDNLSAMTPLFDEYKSFTSAKIKLSR